LQVFEDTTAGLAELSTADAIYALIPVNGTITRSELDQLAERHEICARTTVWRYLTRLKEAGRILWEERGPISRRNLH
jgi:hypothetical protein